MWNRIKQFFIRLFHGSKLSLLSFQCYYYYKKLLLFPLFIALGWSLALMGLFGLFSVDFVYPFFEQHHYLFGLVIALPFYFCIAFINAFFQVATVYAVATYCETNQSSIARACWQSLTKMRLVAPWAAMEAVIRLLSSKKEKEDAGNSAVKFIMGTSWQYLSFFIYQIFAFEQTGLIAGLKRSTHLMKKYFGTVTGSMFAFSAISSLMLFVMLGIGFSIQGFAWLIEGTSLDAYLQTLDEKVVIVFMVLPYFCTTFFFMVHLVSIAKTVMSTMLYRHVHNKSTGFLSPAVLDAAIREVK